MATYNKILTDNVCFIDRHKCYLYFDGVDDYVLVTNHPSLNFGVGDFSVIAWFKINSISGYRGIISKWDGIGGAGHEGWAVGAWDNDARIAFEILGADQDQMVSTNTFNDSNWHFVVALRESGTMKLYIDNNLEASASNSQNLDNARKFIIGTRYDLGQYWNGSLDEVAIWAEALSANDISDLYNSGNGLYFTTASTWPTDGGSMGTNLKGLWHFDEGTGTSAADSSGNSNTGTLINMEEADWVTGKVASSPTTSEIDVWKAKDATTELTDGEIDLGSANVKINLLGIPMLPSYTTAQRDALTAVNGMIIYNSTTNAINGYENGAWVDL